MIKSVRTFGALLPLAAIVFAAEERPPLNPGYLHGEYTFSGKWEIAAGETRLGGTFRGHTTAESFECSWIFDKENKRGWGTSTGTVKIDQSGGVFTQNDLAEKRFSEPKMAIAAASGVSYGSVPLVYGLWTGDRSAVLPRGEIRTAKDGDKLIVSSKDGLKTVAIIDGIVVSSRTVIDRSEERAAVKALGEAASRERSDETRGILDADRESAKDSLDDVVTTITLKVDRLPK